MRIRHTRQRNLYAIQWRPYTRRRVWLSWERPARMPGYGLGLGDPCGVRLRGVVDESGRLSPATCELLAGAR